MERSAKRGLKTLNCPKYARRYWYRLLRYRHRLPSASFCPSGTGTSQSGTGTAVPIFFIFLFYFIIYIYIYIFCFCKLGTVVPM